MGGWTWGTVGAATCRSCVRIRGIAPLVPIAPMIHADMHRQWMSYGGWTFAFEPYLEVNLTTYLDDPRFATNMMAVIDPINYPEALARIPKLAVVSSDDEFMSMDWTNIWYDQFQQTHGETHLLIAPDSEHSLATGIPEVIETVAVFISSVAAGHTEADRPQFTYAKDEATGAITVSVDAAKYAGPPPKVVLRHAQTTSNTRRDFRWVRLADNATNACKLPDLPLPTPLFGGNCVQPIIWIGKTLKPDAPVPSSTVTTWTATPPEPSRKGHWTGYYVELYFKSDTGMSSDFQFSTPGFTWPDTLPFPDCHGKGCAGTLL